MSLIHQALKKLEAGKSPASTTEYAFKKTGTRALRPFVLPVLVLISIVIAYFTYAPASKKNEAVNTASKAVRPASTTNAPQKAVVVNSVPDLSSLARQEYQAGRFTQAEAILKDAIKKKPASADLQNDLGAAALRLGKKKEAQAAFKKALELDSVHPQALNNYASVLFEMGQSAKALPLVERAIKADPSYADARFNMAVMLEKRGDLQGSLSSYEEFLRLSPTDAAASGVRRKLMSLRSELILKQARNR